MRDLREKFSLEIISIIILLVTAGFSCWSAYEASMMNFI